MPTIVEIGLPIRGEIGGVGIRERESKESIKLKGQSDLIQILP